MKNKVKQITQKLEKLQSDEIDSEEEVVSSASGDLEDEISERTQEALPCLKRRLQAMKEERAKMLG